MSTLVGEFCLWLIHCYSNLAIHASSIPTSPFAVTCLPVVMALHTLDQSTVQKYITQFRVPLGLRHMVTVYPPLWNTVTVLLWCDSAHHRTTVWPNSFHQCKKQTFSHSSSTKVACIPLFWSASIFTLAATCFLIGSDLVVVQASPKCSYRAQASLQQWKYAFCSPLSFLVVCIQNHSEVSQWHFFQSLHPEPMHTLLHVHCSIKVKTGPVHETKSKKNLLKTWNDKNDLLA